ASAVAFSPDSTLLTTDTTVWNPRTGAQVTALRGGSSYDVAFSPDGKLIGTAAGFEPNGLRLYDTSTGELVRTVSTDYFSALAFSPDGTLVAGATGYRGAGVVLFRVDT